MNLADVMMQFHVVPRLHKVLDDLASSYFLPPIDQVGLQEIVQTPARLVGLTWSDPQLPEDIVKEASGEPGALPLVENLLYLLWTEAHKVQSQTLSRQVYNDLGGVGGALAKSADALVGSFGKEGKQHALHLLTALVTVGSASRERQDTRRTITKAMALDAAGGGKPAESILNQLSGLRGPETQGGTRARPRLVVLSTGSQNGATTDLVDLAHETLLRYNRNAQPYWPMLRQTIQDQREQIEHRQLAEALAKGWDDKGRSRWRGLATWRQLKEFCALRDLDGNAAAYVAASRQLSKSLKRFIAVIACVLIPYLAVAGWSQFMFNGLETRLAAKFLVTQLGIDLLSPQMVDIQAGRFLMGDSQEMAVAREIMIDGKKITEMMPGSKGLFEDPVHEVTFQQGFKLGKYEVTFDDYEPFVKVNGYKDSIINDQGWGRGRRPAINVTWEDAKAYSAWLSELTGKHYRLPTEAEWEYAARAGTKTEYWWEPEIDANRANCKGCGSQSYHYQTAPVGSFLPPNQFGLHDTAGNVREWVEDCWHNKYGGAPSDGTAWLEAEDGDCRVRMMRGGSWTDEPVFMRSAERSKHLIIGLKGGNIGFRLAQEIP